MKVISLQQPWASLVVAGHKRIETRSWKTKFRGEILIHASASQKTLNRQIMLDFQQQFFDLQLPKYESLPFGAIIGKVNINDTFPMEHLDHYLLNFHSPLTDFKGCGVQDWEIERAFGDYSFGRHGWILSNPVQFIKPIPAKGSLSIWNYQFEGKDQAFIIQCQDCGYAACSDAIPISKCNIDTDEEEWDTWCPKCESDKLETIIENLPY